MTTPLLSILALIVSTAAHSATPISGVGYACHVQLQPGTLAYRVTVKYTTLTDCAGEAQGVTYFGVDYLPSAGSYLYSLSQALALYESLSRAAARNTPVAWTGVVDTTLGTTLRGWTAGF